LLADVSENRPDLVLLDIHLAGEMDGLEAAAILHEQFNIPVILLTAYADSTTIERAKRTQPYAYVLKPFNERELRTSIELALYRSTMERRMKASEQRYRLLFSVGQSAQCIVNPDGSVLEGNPAFLNLLETTEYHASILSLFDAGSDNQSIQAALVNHSEITNAEMHLRTRRGNERIVLVSLTSFQMETDKHSFLCQLSDITEKQELSNKLMQSQKMDALGRLSSSIAHEFNNILTAILGYARMLESEIGDTPNAITELEGIIRSTERASGLTRQLLTFSRNDPVNADFIKVEALCLDLEQLLSRLVGKGIRISSSHQAIDKFVYADKLRLEQAVMNLCLNAKDAMGEDGIIELRSGLHMLTKPQKSILQDIPAGDWVFISVRDTGEGISPAVIVKIFEPFFTTKKAGKGTGLGLSTVLGIVQSAGGYIDVVSLPGQGSCFTLFLPARTVSAQN
jgi:two-component system cell cycle sensor histidine kinase/response regulator CckA